MGIYCWRNCSYPWKVLYRQDFKVKDWSAMLKCRIWLYRVWNNVYGESQWFLKMGVLTGV